MLELGKSQTIPGSWGEICGKVVKIKLGQKRGVSSLSLGIQSPSENGNGT